MMIFSNGLDDKVRDGTKTQTRRLVKEGDTIRGWSEKEIVAIYDQRERRKWKEGRTYAIQPKRGVKGNGRFRITKIRKETLQSITEADARAEGIPKRLHGSVMKQLAFKQLWNSIHKKSGTRWEDNPLVWVLDIENVGSD